MSTRDKQLWLLILALFLLPNWILGWMDAQTEHSIKAENHCTNPVKTECSEIIKEEPFEAHKIELALLEQGYLNDEVPLTYELQDIAQTACERSGTVPYSLALAVMDKETAGTFNVDAVGVDGHDIGVFQIRKSNHEWLSEETGADPLTPSGNIECGVWFLAYLYDYCDQDWSAALTCYRWGLGHGGDSDYARDVLNKAGKWETVLSRQSAANEWTRPVSVYGI